MDQTAWEACSNPDRLLVELDRRADERKIRLLACAIVRHAPFTRDGRTIWDLLPDYPWFEPGPSDGWPNCRDVIEVVERRSDGLPVDAEWAIGRALTTLAAHHARLEITTGLDPGRHARHQPGFSAALALRQTTQESLSDLVRHVFSYRRQLGLWPDALHPSHDEVLCDLTRDLFGNPFRRPLLHREWATEDVVDLATTANKEHAFDLMPILRDALESAGCFVSEILRHCRRDKPHARGCWVVDQILGKEWLPPLGS